MEQRGTCRTPLALNLHRKIKRNSVPPKNVCKQSGNLDGLKIEREHQERVTQEMNERMRMSQRGRERLKGVKT